MKTLRESGMTSDSWFRHLIKKINGQAQEKLTPEVLSSQDYKLVMTTLNSYYSDPYLNAKTLLSHHEKAGKIRKLCRCRCEHAEEYIYTEGYVRTLKSYISFQVQLQDDKLADLKIPCKTLYKKTVD